MCCYVLYVTVFLNNSLHVPSQLTRPLAVRSFGDDRLGCFTGPVDESGTCTVPHDALILHKDLLQLRNVSIRSFHASGEVGGLPEKEHNNICLLYTSPSPRDA